MSHAQFVPLRVFSSFTMLEGAIDPKDFAAKAREHGFPAVAICDRNGLYGVMPFGDACAQKGIQPIIGALLAVARPDRAGQIDWLALYAQDEQGYQNLCALVSAAHLARPADEEAHVDFERLTAHADGLIALTAGAEGALTRLLAGGQHDAANAYVDRLQAIFGDRLYIEIARRKNADEKSAEPHLIAMADGRGIPLVATNPASYADADFHPAHDIALCIAASTYVESDDRVKSSPEDWLKPGRTMRTLFADLPDALANTMIVAQRCAFAAPGRKPILPSLAGNREAEAEQLRVDAHLGLDERLAKVPVADPDAYRARLDFELDVIADMGFPGYFLIVADFIKWAKSEGIPVGPGRGSGAG